MEGRRGGESERIRTGREGTKKLAFFFCPSPFWMFILFVAVREGAFPSQGDSQIKQRTSNACFRDEFFAHAFIPIDQRSRPEGELTE